MLSRRHFLAAAAVPPGLPPPDRLILALPTVQILREEWNGGIDNPAHPGSLWKPFLAASYSGKPLRFHCDGSNCWLGRRHGWLDMPGAIAQSCNQWFHQLFPLLPVPLPALQHFGLPEQTNKDWPQWPCPPRRLARAFAELVTRRQDHPLVLAGLRQAAAHGTAKALGDKYLAKTGTAPSEHHAGDGWVFAAHPADMPTRLILYRQRGVIGATAAAALAAELKRTPL